MTRDDLQMVPTDELVGELCRRHLAVVIGAASLDPDAAADDTIFLNGPSDVLLSLGARVFFKVGQVTTLEAPEDTEDIG